MPIYDDPNEYRKDLDNASELDKLFHFVGRLEIIASEGTFDQLADLLRNYNFLDMKLQDRGLIQSVKDFDLTHRFDMGGNTINEAQKNALLVLKEALRKLNHTLIEDYKRGKDPYDEFAAQLMARLHNQDHKNIYKEAPTSRRKQGKITLKKVNPKVATKTSPHQEFAYHHSIVCSIAISSDGKTVVSGESDNNVLVWELASGELHYPALRDHTDAITSLKITRDGIIVSGSCDGTVRLWDIATGKLRHTLIAPDTDSVGIERANRIRGFPLSPNSYSDCQGNRVNSVVVHDTAAFVAYEDGWVRKWDVATGGYLGRIALCYGEAYTIAASHDLILPNDFWIIIGRKGGLTVYSTCLSRPFEIEINEYGSIRAIDFVPNSTKFVCSLRSSGIERIIFIDIKRTDNGKIEFIKSYLANSESSLSAMALSFTPDGRYLVICDHYGQVQVWDWQQRRIHYKFDGHVSQVYSLAITPDGQFFLTGGNHLVKIWSLANCY